MAGIQKRAINGTFLIFGKIFRNVPFFGTIADHTYSEEGLYLCSASGTGPTGASFSGAAALTVNSISMLNVGSVSTAYNSGNSVTLTAPVTGLVIGETATAWAGASGSPQTPAALTDHGDGTGTITATFTDVPMSFTGTTLWVYSEDGDDSASAGAIINPYQASLTIGDAVAPTPPHESAATAFIPVDDGYMTDTQSVPNDQLADADPTDPALVYGYASFSTRLDLTGTWQLNFPSGIRAFEVETDGTLTELQSGTASSPMTIDNDPDTIPLAFEGVSATGSAMITAVLTPTSLPSSQPAQAQAQAVVGPAFEVLSVQDNSPGAILTPAQQQQGAYVPFSNWDNTKKTGVQYNLPIVIHNLDVRAALELPTGWVAYGSNGNPMQSTPNNYIILLPAPTSDTRISLEAAAGASAGTLKLQQVNKNNQWSSPLNGVAFTYPVLGSINIQPFILSPAKQSGATGAGPTDVPQYGTIMSFQGGTPP